MSRDFRIYFPAFSCELTPKSIYSPTVVFLPYWTSPAQVLYPCQASARSLEAHHFTPRPARARSRPAASANRRPKRGTRQCSSRACATQRLRQRFHRLGFRLPAPRPQGTVGTGGVICTVAVPPLPPCIRPSSLEVLASASSASELMASHVGPAPFLQRPSPPLCPRHQHRPLRLAAVQERKRLLLLLPLQRPQGRLFRP